MPEGSEPPSPPVLVPPLSAGVLGLLDTAGSLAPPLLPPQPARRDRTIIMARIRLREIFFMFKSFLSYTNLPEGIGGFLSPVIFHFSLFPRGLESSILWILSGIQFLNLSFFPFLTSPLLS